MTPRPLTELLSVPVPRTDQAAPADDTGLAAVAAALCSALDAVDDAALRHPDIDTLATTVPDCVRVAGLLAALTGSLDTLATTLADRVVTDNQDPAQAVALLDVSADLATMRSLLHRATLVAAPAVADLRRCRVKLAD